MKISVVIPAYNEEKNILHTIEAILAQNYADFEIIVVNNASTDKTLEVCTQFSQKYPNKIKVVTETRKGLLWARECGRINASGEIIANIDADCLPENNWLSRGASIFEKDNISGSKIVAVTGPYDYYDGGWLFRNISLFTQKNFYKMMSVFIQLPIIKSGALLIGGNNMIRSEILRKTNGYNTDLTFYGEDTDTAKRVVRYGKVLFKRNLTMKTSARRFKDEGTVKITIKYLYHFFKTIFTPRKK